MKVGLHSNEENPELDDDNGTEDGTAGSKNDATNFFEQPIFLQLPEMPNSTIASSLSPGFGWAPSLPHLTSLKFSREEISNMMLRAKCGIKSGDVQKLAHMFFYMGIVYENKKNYKKVKFQLITGHSLLQELLQRRKEVGGQGGHGFRTQQDQLRAILPGPAQGGHRIEREVHGVHGRGKRLCHPL
jgi:hypothetical protein